MLPLFCSFGGSGRMGVVSTGVPSLRCPSFTLPASVKRAVALQAKMPALLAMFSFTIDGSYVVIVITEKQKREGDHVVVLVAVDVELVELVRVTVMVVVAVEVEVA
mmetsp:Transcript_71311/g.202265  ORF Transcript_71311/g.202265 Transcript_71311/m.202265 type:complete len:106 (+) Transcript_71311:541-858(+)